RLYLQMDLGLQKRLTHRGRHFRLTRMNFPTFVLCCREATRKKSPVNVLSGPRRPLSITHQMLAMARNTLPTVGTFWWRSILKVWRKLENTAPAFANQYSCRVPLRCG